MVGAGWPLDFRGSSGETLPERPKFPKGSRREIGEDFPEHDRSGAPTGADPVLLSDVVDSDGNLIHQITSAKVRSTRRKKKAPETTRTRAAATETRSGIPGGRPVPSRPQRNPSTTPTIGFRP